MVDKLMINVELKSPTLLGSGEGWGSLIDSDIVYDRLGLPSFPARRLKGLLRESAQEVTEMFTASGIDTFEPGLLDSLFGTAKNPGSGAFSDLGLEHVEETRAWLEWAFSSCGYVISPETVVDTFTEIRQQTAIDDDGVAKDYSLRTLRLLKAGLKFSGAVSGKVQGQELDLLALACANLRRVGGTRNRGFGEVSCFLTLDGQDFNSQALQKIKEGA